MIFKAVQLESATFTLQTNPGVGKTAVIATFPLEAAFLVWKHHTNGWQIAVHGQILHDGTYQPSTQVRAV